MDPSRDFLWFSIYVKEACYKGSLVEVARLSGAYGTISQSLVFCAYLNWLLIFADDVVASRAQESQRVR